MEYNCETIGCDCSPPSRQLLGRFLATYAGKNCSNPCGNHAGGALPNTGNNPTDDACGYYLRSTTQEGGIYTGRTVVDVFPTEANSCGNNCFEAERIDCSGGWSFSSTVTSEYTYPCGSGIEEIGITNGQISFNWNDTTKECELTEDGEQGLFQCSGSISGELSGEYTYNGSAQNIDGECIMVTTITSLRGQGTITVGYGLQQIGFGIADFGGSCSGQDSVLTENKTRSPEEMADSISVWDEQNVGCDGWCGEELEEIPNIQNEIGFFNLSKSINLQAGSSVYGNIKFNNSSRFKFVHYPTVTCYLKVWFRKREITIFPAPPEVGVNQTFYDCGPFFGGNEETAITDTIYEWRGTQKIENLCVDPKKNIIPDQLIYDTQQEIELEAENGTSKAIDFFVLKYSFIEGYEPNDPDEFGDQGDSPSGFPNP
jgi:hypothetical protein